ncbi:hypothetical protein QTP88_021032 [Uroleucon formosanum]
MNPGKRNESMTLLSYFPKKIKPTNNEYISNIAGSYTTNLSCWLCCTKLSQE